MKKDGDDGDDRNIVAFFSLEMSAEELATRLLSQEAGVPSHQIRRGDIKDEDFVNFATVRQELSRVPLFLDDTPALSVSTLRTRARRLKRQQKGLGLIVVDYLQLLRASLNARPENRVQEVSDITRSLKALAKELEVPVIALSQLSRGPEQRTDKRPMLSDLRESGSIEQDADLVMFLYRPEYYATAEKRDELEGKSELIISKQRNGPTGVIQLYFQKSYTRFDSVLPHGGAVGGSPGDGRGYGP
jgi:replicative DNA helicase